MSGDQGNVLLFKACGGGGWQTRLCCIIHFPAHPRVLSTHPWPGTVGVLHPHDTEPCDGVTLLSMECMGLAGELPPDPPAVFPQDGGCSLCCAPSNLLLSKLGGSWDVGCSNVCKPSAALRLSTHPAQQSSDMVYARLCMQGWVCTAGYWTHGMDTCKRKGAHG